MVGSFLQVPSSFSIAAVASDYGACSLCSDHAAGKGCINKAQSTCILFSSEQFTELNVLQKFIQPSCHCKSKSKHLRVLHETQENWN